MNAETSRSPALQLPAFRLPLNLTPQQALNIFLSYHKPRTFQLEGYKYFSKTGVFVAKGYDKPDGT